MNPLWTIVKRELASFFVSPIATVFIVVFLVLAGFFTLMVGGFLERGEAGLGAFFMWMPWLYLFLVPAVGMRMWAEERRLGTLELILTLPVPPWQIIIGKFLGAWAVIALALALTFPLVITVNYLGDPDNGVIVAGYAASLLLAGSYLSLSSLASALTRNQVISFVLAAAACLFLVLAGWPPVTDFLEKLTAPQVVDAMASASVMTRFDSMQRGLLDSRDIIYFLSLIGFGLASTSFVLRMQRAS